jgi:hypothetical protein
MGCLTLLWTRRTGWPLQSNALLMLCQVPTMGEPLTDEMRALWDDPRVIAISNEVARHHAEDITAERDRYREALKLMLSGDVTLTMDGPHPGVGLDYSYVRAGPEVMATLAEVNRLAALTEPEDR